MLVVDELSLVFHLIDNTKQNCEIGLWQKLERNVRLQSVCIHVLQELTINTICGRIVLNFLYP